MVKRTYNHVALADFEIKAQEFISMAFELCEQDLRDAHEPVAHAPGLAALRGDVQKQPIAVRVLLYLPVSLLALDECICQFHGSPPVVKSS